MARKVNLAVLLSGGGRTLQNIIDHIRNEKSSRGTRQVAQLISSYGVAPRCFPSPRCFNSGAAPLGQVAVDDISNDDISSQVQLVPMELYEWGIVNVCSFQWLMSQGGVNIAVLPRHKLMPDSVSEQTMSHISDDHFPFSS